MRQHRLARPPMVGYSSNPLVPIRPADMRPARIGSTLRDGAPAETGGTVCTLNGEIILRADWELVLQPGDLVVWMDVPRGREGFRTVLQIAVIIIAIWFPALLPYAVAINAAYNILVPPRPPKRDMGDKAANVYSASLQGNQARLDEPIWRNCGRPKITPPFAAQPYLEFVQKDPSPGGINGESDQYYYVLLAIGIGNHDIEKVFIGKTPIAHFADVVVKRYLPPGTLPTDALANVVTSMEVSGAALELADGRYVGGYAVCRPGDRCRSVGIDVSAGQGLGVFGTSTHSVTAEWRVEFRQIDDLGGSPIGEWQILADESRTAQTNTTLRWSNEYELPAPMRCEIRLVRTDIKNKDADARDGIQWIGLRGYRAGVAPLNAETAHYEIVLRASEQLSAQAQSDLSMVVRTKVRRWTPGSGWGPEVFSRNPADWLADLWSSPTWGEGLPDERIDLQGIYEWGLTCAARQDHFDFTFARSSDSWEAAQLICRAGRARPFRRGSVFTLARDELVDVPIAAFTSRNTAPKSMVMHATLPKREQADGVVIEYQSNVTWDTERIYCPCPGYSVPGPVPGADPSPRFDPLLPEMSRPVFITLDGVTGAFHAEREGLYQAASMALRTTTVSCKVEMEGVIVAYLDTIRWQPLLPNYGQCGDVAFWDPDALVMGLTEQPAWGDEPLLLTLQRDDLTLTTPVAVSPGPSVWDVVLPEAPDFQMLLDDGTRERPKFMIGPADTGDEVAKIASITDGGRSDGGAQLSDISAVIDNDLVHERDNFLLPGPGDIQDPIDDGVDVGSDESGDGGPVYGSFLRLSQHQIVAYSAAGATSISLTANNNGALSAIDNDLGPRTFPHEWLSMAPVEPAAAAIYEVMLADPYGFIAALIAANPGNLTMTGEALDTWLPLTSSRVWSLDIGMGVSGTAVCYLRFRRIGSVIVQQDRQIDIIIGPDTPDSGGAGGPGKIICTAMNARYGLPNRESLIWLAYARSRLQPEHQIGYHRVFLPLVRFGFDSGDGWAQSIVRRCLEWIGRERTRDIRDEMGGRNPRPGIRALRRASEWALLQIGRRTKGPT